MLTQSLWFIAFLLAMGSLSQPVLKDELPQQLGDARPTCSALFWREFTAFRLTLYVDRIAFKFMGHFDTPAFNEVVPK
jgi:hypothetical protein